MNRTITILSGILCMPIFCASAYTEPECTLPLSVFQEHAKSTSNCKPATITKVAYYSNFYGWMVFGESGNNKKCQFKFNTDHNYAIDSSVKCIDAEGTSLSTFTILQEGVPYGCTSDSDCDSANGWVCQNKNSTYGVGICTQTGCGSNCKVGTGNWHNSAGYPEYQERTVITCEPQTNTTYSNYYCSGYPEARCAPGAYGKNPKAGPYSGCTPCPTWSKAYTTSALTTQVQLTSDLGATTASECYVNPNTYYDATGTFKITNNCTP